MPIQVDTVDLLQTYLKGVSERAEHHAQSVDEVCYPLVGLIIKNKDGGTEIEARKYQNKPANMLWVAIKGKRYSFAYDHKTGEIVMRDNTHAEIMRISNVNSTRDLMDFFSKL